jgi:branched-chain amino acid transport system substrate-binding protein
MTMLSRSRRIGAGGVALLTALAATACGTSSGGSSGNDIKIESISESTDATGADRQPEIAAAANARVSYINAHGGINGRQVKLISCNTKTDPNVATQCARQAVSEKVAAVVGLTSNNEQQILPILQSAGIPAIGTVVFSGAAGSSPVNFGFNSGVVGAFAGGAELLAAQGAKKITFLGPSDVKAAAGAISSFEAGARIARVQATAPIGFTSTQVQFDAVVQNLMQQGSDGVLAYGSSTAQQVSLIRAIRQRDPKIIISTAAIRPEVITALGAGANGVYSVGLSQPATSGARGVKLFNSDMDAYGGSASRTDQAEGAWAAVWTFERLAAKLPSVTSSTVLDALKGMRNYDMGGIYPPISTDQKFTAVPGFPTIYNPTVVYQVVKNGQLYAIDGKFVDPFTGKVS